MKSTDMLKKIDANRRKHGLIFGKVSTSQVINILCLFFNNARRFKRIFFNQKCSHVREMTTTGHQK